MPPLAVALAWFAAGLLAFAAAAQGGFHSALQLAFDAACTSTGLICWAIGGAVLGGGPVAQRLGFVPSGLGAPVQAGLVLGLIALSQGVEWAIARAGLQDVGTLAEIRGVLARVTHGELAVALLGVALLPGFGEELAFRGLVQRGLARSLGAVPGVVLAAALFGAVHGDPIHAAGAFFLGLYLGAIVALCGSVWPAILCHAANNAVATLGASLGLGAGGPWLLVAGLVAGPWALWRTVLQRRAAHASLGGSPEAPDAPPPA